MSRISVIMPVYNAEQYLALAIDSILAQTYTDFELLVINDGSKDTSGTIIDAFAQKDSRVKAVHQENHGLVATLNRGIEMAQGEYIARMDADDISFPKRFEQQVAVLDNQPGVVLVAGNFEVIDEEGEFLYRELVPALDRDIKRAMLLRNPIAHGSVMFRKKALEITGPYSSEVGPTEDFDLWSRLATVGQFVGLEATIFRWRVNTQGITSNNNKLQLKIMKDHVAKRWEQEFPVVLSASTLRNEGRHYFNTYKKHGFGMRNIMLADNAHIAIKMIQRGKIGTGLRQLLAVGLSTRTGLSTVLHRIGLTIHSRARRIRSFAKYGRQEV